MTPQEHETFTYRGRSLEELVPRIRQDLGDDAVIVARRETSSGGVGGFFAKREIEVEVRPGSRTGPAPGVAAAFAQQLAEAQGLQARPPGEVRPATGPEIDAIPVPPTPADVTVDDLFPAPSPQASQNLAALFNAGLPPAEPPVVPEEEPIARREVLDDDEWEEV